MASQPEDQPSTKYILEPKCELRFEVKNTHTASAKLVMQSGLCEIFGTELIRNREYVFPAGSKVAAFTWYGCTLALSGQTEGTYVSTETPMLTYVNTHVALEQLREQSDKDHTKGPSTMIVGPADVGKTTLCRLLLNYAVRTHRRPIYVDLDVSQGQLAIPGTIAAVPVERPADPVEGFSTDAPLVYHFGHVQPATNPALYQLLVHSLAETIQLRFEKNKKSASSGIIINTAGWIREFGYKAITDIAETFEVDIILVVDSERLYNELKGDMPDFVKTLHVPKSGGVVERSREQREASRHHTVHEYFYGPKTRPLYPHSFDVRFSEVKIFKVGAPNLPASLLPLGMKAEDKQTKLVPVSAGPAMVNHVLAVSMASSSEADQSDQTVVASNVAGFVVVTSVNMDKQQFSVVSPAPRPLPRNVLLLSDVQYMELM